MTDYMDYVSNRIVALREEKGETQQELADAIGITRQSLSRYEIAARTISIDALGQIAQHYDVSVDYLMGLSDIKSTEQDMKTACAVTGFSESEINYLSEHEDALLSMKILIKYEKYMEERKYTIFPQLYNYIIASCPDGFEKKKKIFIEIAAKLGGIENPSEEDLQKMLKSSPEVEKTAEELVHMTSEKQLYASLHELRKSLSNVINTEVTDNAQHHKTEE